MDGRGLRRLFMVAVVCAGGLVTAGLGWAGEATQEAAGSGTTVSAPQQGDVQPVHDHAAMGSQQNAAAVASGQPGPDRMGAANGPGMMGGSRGPARMGGPGYPGHPGMMGGPNGPAWMGGPGYPGYPGMMGGPGYPGMMGGPGGPGMMGGPNAPQKSCAQCAQHRGGESHKMCKMCAQCKKCSPQGPGMGEESGKMCKMCGQPGSNMGGESGKMCKMCGQRGGRMGGSAGMMGMRDPVHLGYHPGMAEQALSFLKEQLAVTQAQEGVWKGYADAVMAVTQAHVEKREGMRTPPDSALALVESRTQFATQMTEKRQQATAAFKELLAQLTEEQKAKVNQLFVGFAR